MQTRINMMSKITPATIKLCTPINKANYEAMKEDWLDGETHFFYSTQYNYVSLVENDSYVIDNDLYVRIRQLSLILYHQFFCVVWYS
jgi:hypothetical protein